MAICHGNHILIYSLLQALELVKASLAGANLRAHELSDVVLVGGTSRMPKVQAMLKEMRGGKDPLRSINPDEAVAYGAALQAAKLSGNCGSAMDNFLLQDVTPLSLGVMVKGDLLSILVPKNTGIPCRRTSSFCTSEDNQTAVDICIYEGERPIASKNHLLGSIRFEDLVPAPRGAGSFPVVFSISSDGIFTVEATDELRDETKVVNIQSRQLSSKDVQRMVREAKQHEEEDRLRERMARARNRLDSLLYDSEAELMYENVLFLLCPAHLSPNP